MPTNDFETEWTMKDLKTLNFNVEMIRVRAEEFFGCEELDELPDPQFIYPHLQEILTVEIERSDRSFSKDVLVAAFLENIINAVQGASGNMLVKDMLMYMGYRNLAPLTTISLPLQPLTHIKMNRGRIKARPTLAMTDTDGLLLSLYVEATKREDIVAYALGAYYTNLAEAQENPQLRNALQPEADESYFFDMIIPVFTLHRTVPYFFLIPITASLASAVAHGKRPPHPTRVYWCSAPLHLELFGMFATDQRLLILRMFEAFKRFIPLNFAQLCRISRLGTFIPPPIKPDCPSFVWNKISQFFIDIDQICRSKGFERFDYPRSFDNRFRAPSALFSDINNTESYSPNTLSGLQPQEMHIGDDRDDVEDDDRRVEDDV